MSFAGIFRLCIGISEEREEKKNGGRNHITAVVGSWAILPGFKNLKGDYRLLRCSRNLMLRKN